jgi:hypothetical protein
VKRCLPQWTRSGRWRRRATVQTRLPDLPSRGARFLVGPPSASHASALRFGAVALLVGLPEEETGRRTARSDPLPVIASYPERTRGCQQQSVRQEGKMARKVGKMPMGRSSGRLVGPLPLRPGRGNAPLAFGDSRRSRIGRSIGAKNPRFSGTERFFSEVGELPFAIRGGSPSMANDTHATPDRLPGGRREPRGGEPAKKRRVGQPLGASCAPPGRR